MAQLDNLYAQLVRTNSGEKIKVHEKTSVFIDLLNKKLGKKYVQLKKINEKIALISCIDIRLKEVTYVSTNKKINKLIAAAHKKFIELQSSRSWGIESSFLKSLIFCDFAKSYYDSFRQNRRPAIISNTWVSYFNGTSFEPSKNIISTFDKYWLGYWNNNEVQQWLTNVPPDIPTNSLFDAESLSWVEDVRPFFEALPKEFNVPKSYNLVINKYHMTLPITNFPCILNIDPLIEKITEKNNFSFSKNIVLRFKIAHFFRRINLYISKIIDENLDVKPRKDEMLEALKVNFKDIMDKWFNKYLSFIVENIRKIKYSVEKTKRTDKVIGQITYMGNEIYIECGRELCAELDVWLTYVKTSY